MREPNRQTFILFLAIISLFSFLISKINLITRQKPEEKVSTVSPIQQTDEPTPNESTLVKSVEVKPLRKIENTEFAEPKIEKEYSGPEWLKKVISTHEKYYPSWQTGKSITASTQQKSTSSSNVASPSTFSPAIPTATSTTSLAAGATRVVSPAVVKTTPATSSTGVGTPAFSGSGGGIIEENNENESGNDENNQPPVQPTPITIVRSIDSSGLITLVLTVQGEVSGLVIVETLPSGYTITSATPNYSKKSNTSYRWLLYGKSISSQSITYQVSGSDGGKISGTYSSTKGSGSITGQNSL